MKIVVKAEGSAPPDVTFSTLADIPNWPRFVAGITKIAILNEGPIGIGMRVRATGSGGAMRGEMRLAAMDAPRRLVLYAEDQDYRYVATSEIVPNGNGSRLTLTYETFPLSFGARLRGLSSLILARGARRQLQRDVADIAHEAERRMRA